jgi:RNA polymerase II subunit A small phosphatase-like protein/CTD small phosphatase-like protein 2
VYPEENIDDFLKDLERLNRDIKRVVYIDTKPISFWMYPNNGIKN